VDLLVGDPALASGQKSRSTWAVHADDPPETAARLWDGCRFVVDEELWAWPALTAADEATVGCRSRLSPELQSADLSAWDFFCQPEMFCMGEWLARRR
jgi:hypothetical protein